MYVHNVADNNDVNDADAHADANDIKDNDVAMMLMLMLQIMLILIRRARRWGEQVAHRALMLML